MGYWGIATGVIGSAELADGSIVAIDLCDGAVITCKLANDAVTDMKLAPEAVQTVHIADNAIVAAHIGEGQIFGAHISDGQVGEAKIANYSVTRYKIANGAIRSEHVASVQWNWPSGIWVKHTGGLLCIDGSAQICVNSGTLYVSSCGSTYLNGYNYLYGYNYLCGAQFAYGYSVNFNTAPCFSCGFDAYGRAYFGGSMILPSYGNTCDGNGQLRWCSSTSKVQVYCNGTWYALH